MPIVYYPSSRCPSKVRSSSRCLQIGLLTSPATTLKAASVILHRQESIFHIMSRSHPTRWGRPSSLYTCCQIGVQTLSSSGSVLIPNLCPKRLRGPRKEEHLAQTIQALSNSGTPSTEKPGTWTLEEACTGSASEARACR